MDSERDLDLAIKDLARKLAPRREPVRRWSESLDAIDDGAPPVRKRRTQVFRERDVRRAIAGHLKAGLSVHHTMVDKDGRIMIFTGKSEPTSVVPANEWDDAL